MKTVLEKLVGPRDLLALTLVYPERSEKVEARLIELLEDGLLVEALGEMRFINYDIVKDFRKLKASDESHQVDQHRVVEIEKDHAAVPMTATRDEPQAEPRTQEVEPRIQEPEPRIQADEPRDASDSKKTQVIADNRKKLVKPRMSNLFVEKIEGFRYPNFIAKEMPKNQIGKRLISAHDKVAYAMKVKEYDRLSEIPLQSLVDGALKQYDPAVNLAVAHLARLLDRTQQEFEALNTYILRRELRAIPPVMQILFQTEEFEEAAKWGSEAAVLFSEDKLPFKLSDLELLKAACNDVSFDISRPSGEVLEFKAETAKATLIDPEYSPEEKLEEAAKPNSNKARNELRFGKISAYFPQDKAAYISGQDGVEYYLSTTSIVNIRLRNSIESGTLNQEVGFTCSSPQDGRTRPFAQNAFPLNEEELVVIRSKTTSSPVVRKSGGRRTQQSLYKQAKDAHLSVDHERAEKLFFDAIKSEPENRPSALKDLAQLLDQRNRTSEAISLLEDNSDAFGASDEIPVLNLLAGYFTKLEDFTEAAKIYQNLYTLQDKSPKRKLVSAKQAAYCLFQVGQVNEAIDFLDSVASYAEPTDTFFVSLREQLDEAVETGITTVPDELIISFAKQANGNETGPILRQAIDACTFDMVDERSRDRGFYGEDDIRALTYTAKRSRGERPALRAQFELNLAAIYDTEASLYDEEGFRDSTFNFLTFSAEAAYVVHRLDTVISYLIEASQSIAAQTKKKAQKIFQMGLAVCVEPKVEVPDYFKIAGGRSLPDEKMIVNGLLRENRHPHVDYFLAIVSSSPAVRQVLDGIGLSSEDLNSIDSKIRKYKEDEEKTFGQLTEILQLSRKLEATEVATILQKIDSIDNVVFDADRNRIRQISTLLEDAAQYFDNDEYVEKELNVRTLSAKVDRLVEECRREPTHTSALFLEPIAINLRTELNEKFSAFSDTVTTTVEVSDLLSDAHYVVDENGQTDFKFLVSTSKGSAPLTDLEMTFENRSGFEVIEKDVPRNLRGGETREAVLTVQIDEETIQEGIVSVFGELTYTERNTGTNVSHDFSMSVSLSPSDDFVHIDNVYEKYGTGSPVDEAEMFFGRAELVDRIERSIRHRSGGQCYVLYGQKRTGKTSVLYRLRETLADEFLPVYLSLGQVDRPEELEKSIATLIFYEIVSTAQEYGLDVDFSDADSSEELPFTIRLRQFSQKLDRKFKEKGQPPRTVVLLVDEFTYIYDAIKVGQTSPTFMRNWKNIIESKIVNAVIVGQDSMPRFISEFANEFGVSDKERISYLSQAASFELCSHPILLDGATRYKGESLKRIYEITNGAAFFLQKFCFELVEFLNHRKRPYISQADVDHVFKMLCEGQYSLQEADFDPLLQEASNATSVFSRDENMAVLRQIAGRSDESRGAVLDGIDLPSNWKSILEDLQERDVIFSRANSRYSIKMELFAEWLRVNRPI